MLAAARRGMPDTTSSFCRIPRTLQSGILTAPCSDAPATLVPPDVPIPPTPSPEFLGAALATTGERDSRAVLIVDDNPAARGMMRVPLEKSGYRVFEAGDGQTAIALLARHRPALVLQDLHLPDVDGVALVSQLRAVPAGEDIPILAFSGLMSKV